MNKDTPVFPAPATHQVGGGGGPLPHPGMTLRAYLVAHAPAVPKNFEPVLPEAVLPDMPFPVGDSKNGTLSAILREGRSPEEAEEQMMLWSDAEKVISRKYLHAWHAAIKQKEDNYQAYTLERAVQWPLAWADAMIERLGRA